jgi:hypothetical protein
MSKRNGLPILCLLGALIAFCTVLNLSLSFLGMYDAATFNDLSLKLTGNLINQAVGRKSYVGDAPVAQTDVWCHGCRFQKILSTNDSKRTCGDLLRPFFNQTQNRLHIQRVIAAYPECSLCSECSQGLYYRYDTVAPRVKQGHTFYLKTVPAINRFPTDQINNVTKFLSESPNNTYPLREMLWEYNPSIVILPASVRKRLGNEEYVYLASFRLCSITNCWDRPTQRLHLRYQKLKAFTSYLGLALLRKDLSVVEEGYYTWMGGLIDYRLFVMEDRDEILLTADHYNVPIHLLPQNEVLAGPMRELHTHSLSAGMPRVAVNINGRGCTNKVGQLVGGPGYKNLNYFIDADNNRLVEYWPMGPHVVDPMGNMSHSCPSPERSLNKSSTVVTGELIEPTPTFGTIEEPFYTGWGKFQPPWGRDRGSACCVKLRGPSMDSLLVGISHVNLQTSPYVFPPSFNQSAFIHEFNSYLSRFYAFEATAPYKIVARSGLFCLGWPSKDERGSSPFQYLGHTLKLVEHFDDCPFINFVSGMTLKADDPSTAIIAYGINDCTSRMVEIDVSEIKRLLFGRKA